jgi:class 3 adenylate cyclase
MSMNENDARQRLKQYLKLHSDYVPRNWCLTDKPRFRQLCNGDWLVTNPDAPDNGILLKSDGRTFPFFGALGKLVSELGYPASREHFLASASLGRYQAYDRGLAIWEKLEGFGDLGYPVAKWESIDERAKSCLALIAFFDLRGFTNWSDSQDPKRIQEVIEQLEQSFQDAFSRRWSERLFAKSAGDGFMVVSEAGQFATGEKTTDADFQAGHAKAFCRACAETVRNAAEKIPNELAVGCGVTVGKITQMYLLGRFDYIGPEVNEASKIQAIAYNELCISNRVVECLQKDGVEVEGKVVPGKGMRVRAESLIPEEGPEAGPRDQRMGMKGQVYILHSFQRQSGQVVLLPR